MRRPAVPALSPIPGDTRSPRGLGRLLVPLPERHQTVSEGAPLSLRHLPFSLNRLHVFAWGHFFERRAELASCAWPDLLCQSVHLLKRPKPRKTAKAGPHGGNRKCLRPYTRFSLIGAKTKRSLQAELASPRTSVTCLERKLQC